MEISTMGKVIVSVRMQNLSDVYDAEKGTISAEGIRTVEVADALIDTGATMLSMPQRLVRQLGLQRSRMRTARTTAGKAEFGIYGAVRLTIQGRECIVECAELPDDCPVLIGQVPLELLDFVVDPVGQKLLGNPDHGGEQMIDLF